MSARKSAPKNRRLPANFGAPWQSDEYARMVEQAQANASFADIAEALGRSEGAVDSAMKKLIRRFRSDGLSNDEIVEKTGRCAEYVADALENKRPARAESKPAPSDEDIYIKKYLISAVTVMQPILDKAHDVHAKLSADIVENNRLLGEILKVITEAAKVQA